MMHKQVHITIIFIALCFLPKAVDGQIKFGIRGGLNTTEVNANSLLVLDRNSAEDLRLEVESANYGYHLGLFLQGNADFLFIQPEIWFRSSSVDYKLDDLQNGSGETILNERYQYIDIPVQLGVRLGPIRIGCGPVGHVFINSVSEFVQQEGFEYEQDFDEMTVGYIAGIGLDVWSFHLDLSYEGNFNKFGDHFTFYGNEYSFDRSPARLIGTVGISF